MMLVNAHLRAYCMLCAVLCALQVFSRVILSVTLQEVTHFINGDTDFREVKYLVQGHTAGSDRNMI